MFQVQKRENFGWVSELRKAPVERRSVWERLTGSKRDDDDDDHDLPGPNAGATLWPAATPRKAVAFA
jgi:hypothetical protein